MEVIIQQDHQSAALFTNEDWVASSCADEDDLRWFRDARYRGGPAHRRTTHLQRGRSIHPSHPSLSHSDSHTTASCCLLSTVRSIHPLPLRQLFAGGGTTRRGMINDNYISRGIQR